MYAYEYFYELFKKLNYSELWYLYTKSTNMMINIENSRLQQPLQTVSYGELGIALFSYMSYPIYKNQIKTSLPDNWFEYEDWTLNTAKDSEKIIIQFLGTTRISNIRVHDFIKVIFSFQSLLVHLMTIKYDELSKSDKIRFENSNDESIEFMF